MSSDVSVQKIACEQFCILAAGVALQKSKARAEHPAQVFLLLSVRTGAGLELAGPAALGLGRMASIPPVSCSLVSWIQLFWGAPPERWTSRRGNIDGELTWMYFRRIFPALTRAPLIWKENYSGGEEKTVLAWKRGEGQEGWKVPLPEEKETLVYIIFNSNITQDKRSPSRS